MLDECTVAVKLATREVEAYLRAGVPNIDLNAFAITVAEWASANSIDDTATCYGAFPV